MPQIVHDQLERDRLELEALLEKQNALQEVHNRRYREYVCFRARGGVVPYLGEDIYGLTKGISDTVG